MLPGLVFIVIVWLAYLAVAGAAGYLLLTLARDWIGKRLW